MMLLLRTWWPVLLAVAFVGVFIAYGYTERHIGKKLAQTAVIEKQAEADKKVINIKKEVRHETQTKDRDALIRLHCANGWVRNSEHCPE